VKDPRRRARRQAAAARWDPGATGPGPDVRGQDETATPLHDERLDAVVEALLASGARTVLDLGCGSGSLLRRLAAEPRFTRIVGVDTSAAALRVAEMELDTGDARVSLRHGSFMEADPRLQGFDAAAMVETIEHVEPAQLSLVERAVFVLLRPRVVVMTTPNREYNVRYGLADGELRHPDHRFEWSRAKFASWASGVAERSGYRVTVRGVGPVDALLGSPTQMGVFVRAETDGGAGAAA
jgi:small RNA 2'-O-methyltransferase